MDNLAMGEERQKRINVKMFMRNTMSRLERGFTDPESSVHLKLKHLSF